MGNEGHGDHFSALWSAAHDHAKARADGGEIGVVTSGGFSPSLAAPIAMGFVPPQFAAVGTRLSVIVRGKAQSAEVVALPFVPHRYFRRPVL